jgi:hypothetical protein
MPLHKATRDGHNKSMHQDELLHEDSSVVNHSCDEMAALREVREAFAQKYT